MSRPLLSVCIITYNQENYIQKAIESVFAQETNFNIEFIISNDCSSDNSHEKIEEIIKKAPKNFSVRYFNHQQNLGMMKNFIFSLQACTGKYIALCEGDDYWIDNEKLKKQLHFLESNPDFSLCFSNSIIVNELGVPTQLDLVKLESKEYFESDLFSSWLIPTASTLFINRFNEEDYRILKDARVFFGDIIVFLILANKGRLFGMKDYTSAYRINSNSYTNQPKTIAYYEKLFNHLSLLSEMFDYKYKNFNQKKLSGQGYKLFRYYLIKLNPKFLKYVKFVFNK